MGLDTTHDCWHGPYSSFKRFRAEVADAAWRAFKYRPDYEAHPARAFQGWWDDDHPYRDVLDVFFIHSDCDGYIFPQHLDDLVRRLDDLIPWMSDRGPYEFASPREELEQFIRGLRKALDEWDIVQFH
jgi:hypothetical protein